LREAGSSRKRSTSTGSLKRRVIMSERVMSEREPTLTHDEKKAAEAAFCGAPFNPVWSQAARKVYQGISAVMAQRSCSILNEIAIETTKPSVSFGLKRHNSSSKAGSKIP